MTGLEFMIILSFLAFVGVFFYKVANVMSFNRLYSLVTSWLLFIGGLFAYLVSFVLNMVSLTLLSSLLLRINTFLLVLFVVLQFFEAFYLMKDVVASVAERRSSRSP